MTNDKNPSRCEESKNPLILDLIGRIDHARFSGSFTVLLEHNFGVFNNLFHLLLYSRTDTPSDIIDLLNSWVFPLEEMSFGRKIEFCQRFVEGVERIHEVMPEASMTPTLCLESEMISYLARENRLIRDLINKIQEVKNSEGFEKLARHDFGVYNDLYHLFFDRRIDTPSDIIYLLDSDIYPLGNETFGRKIEICLQFVEMVERVQEDFSCTAMMPTLLLGRDGINLSNSDNEDLELKGKTDNNKTSATNAVSLDIIDLSCEKKYSKYAKRIVVIVLARFDLDEVKEIIRKHYDYWHELTGEYLDFYWLGYSARQTPSDYHGERVEDYINGLAFDNHTFIKDVKRLEKLAGYDFGDEIGLLLLDCYGGSVQYEKSLYLNIEALVHQEADTRLKSFFKYLIKICCDNESIESVKTELKTKKTIYSLGDITISDILSVAGTGVGLVGSFIIA